MLYRVRKNGWHSCLVLSISTKSAFHIDGGAILYNKYRYSTPIDLRQPEMSLQAVLSTGSIIFLVREERPQSLWHIHLLGNKVQGQ